MFFLLFFIRLTESKYSWTLDRINQYSFFPDFKIESYNSDENPIDVYVIDSGLNNKKYFYDNIVEKKNFINSIEDDENGHGTFVTSLISSKYYGVTSNVKIHSLKVFGYEGVTSSEYVFNSLKYVRNQCKTLNKCVVNLSLGSERVDEIDKLLDKMFEENILIIAAAGNEDKDCKDFTPSNLHSLLVVGSIDYLNYRSSFSNYGDCVDLYTYGDFVPGLGLNNGMTVMSGTSFSAPIITGYITNFWSNNYNLSNKEVIKRFLEEYTYENNGLKVFRIKSPILNDITMIGMINLVLLPFYIIFYILFKCNLS